MLPGPADKCRPAFAPPFQGPVTSPHINLGELTYRFLRDRLSLFTKEFVLSEHTRHINTYYLFGNSVY